MTFMRVLSSFSVLLCVAAIAFYGWHKQSALPGSEGAAGWQLVWSDEFNYSGLPDAAKWGYDVGGSGWGNKELQYYTDRRKENARVENGHLIIEVRRDGFGNNEYTSARLTSKGKGDWTYGRFEVRAKLPSGRGTWPAIWMLPSGKSYGNAGWPDNGEIDIMEHVGFDPEWPFDKPFHLILNLAVGGTWGGGKGVDQSIWPQRMEIDYVRVYRSAQ